jgi:hypothetical protein
VDFIWIICYVDLIWIICCSERTATIESFYIKKSVGVKSKKLKSLILRQWLLRIRKGAIALKKKAGFLNL